jgi:hypothetical protein
MKFDKEQRKRLFYAGFMKGQLPDYNFPKIRYCTKGHAIVDDNFLIRKTSVVCRTCHRLHHKKTTTTGSVSNEKLQQIRFTIEAGGGLIALEGRRGHRKVGSRIIHVARFKHWVQQNPKEGRPLLKLAIANGVLAAEKARLGRLVASPAIIRATDDIMDVIESAVPRNLTRDHRADVIQNIWIAVLERRLKRSEIASRVREFINAEYRNAHNGYGDRSLDVPIWLDSNTTLLDTLTRGLWD